MTKLCSITQNHPYCPYGYSKPSVDHTGSLQYCGEFLHSIADFYFLGLGARIYSPRIFRFHASDNLSPFSLGGINSYSYCFNDPINLSDPTGHFPLLSRRTTIKRDQNWTFKSRDFYVNKQFRWGSSTTKSFESNEPTIKLQQTEASEQQLQDPLAIQPPPRRLPVHISVKAEALNRIPGSTQATLKAYVRVANQHNDYINQNVRHLPSDSKMTLDFISNQGKARRLRTALKKIAQSTTDEFELGLLRDVLRIRL